MLHMWLWRCCSMLQESWTSLSLCAFATTIVSLDLRSWQKCFCSLNVRSASEKHPGKRQFLESNFSNVLEHLDCTYVSMLGVVWFMFIHNIILSILRVCDNVFTNDDARIPISNVSCCNRLNSALESFKYFMCVSSFLWIWGFSLLRRLSLHPI